MKGTGKKQEDSQTLGPGCWNKALCCKGPILSHDKFGGGRSFSILW